MRRPLTSILLLLLASGAARAQAPDAPRWHDLPAALAAARAEGRPVLVYVHALWCGPCRRMERTVFAEPGVRPLLARFALARLDYGDHSTPLTIGGQTRSPAGWARHLGADATPAFVLLRSDGTGITRMSGYIGAARFGRLLAYVATGAYRHASFEAYLRHAHSPPR